MSIGWVLDQLLVDFIEVSDGFSSLSAEYLNCFNFIGDQIILSQLVVLIENASDYSLDLTVEHHWWYLALKVYVNFSDFANELTQSTDLDVSVYSQSNMDRLVICCILYWLLNLEEVSWILDVLLGKHIVVTPSWVYALQSWCSCHTLGISVNNIFDFIGKSVDYNVQKNLRRLW